MELGVAVLEWWIRTEVLVMYLMRFVVMARIVGVLIPCARRKTHGVVFAGFRVCDIQQRDTNPETRARSTD